MLKAVMYEQHEGEFCQASVAIEVARRCLGYSIEVDNWALGVVTYTLLAGYAPFYHRNQLRMMRMIQEARCKRRHLLTKNVRHLIL